MSEGESIDWALIHAWGDERKIERVTDAVQCDKALHKRKARKVSAKGILKERLAEVLRVPRKPILKAEERKALFMGKSTLSLPIIVPRETKWQPTRIKLSKERQDVTRIEKLPEIKKGKIKLSLSASIEIIY